MIPPLRGCIPVLARPLGHKCTALVMHNRTARLSCYDSELVNNGTVRTKAADS